MSLLRSQGNRDEPATPLVFAYETKLTFVAEATQLSQWLMKLYFRTPNTSTAFCNCAMLAAMSHELHFAVLGLTVQHRGAALIWLLAGGLVFETVLVSHWT